PNSNVQAELQVPSTIICSLESRSLANLFRYLSILPPESSRIRIVAPAELMLSVPILTRINALIKASSFTAEPLPPLPTFCTRGHLAAIAGCATSPCLFHRRNSGPSWSICVNRSQFLPSCSRSVAHLKQSPALANALTTIEA